jgi:ankyrin repeat protein
MRHPILIALLILSAIVLSGAAKASAANEQSKARRRSDSAVKHKSQQIRELIHAANDGDNSRVIEILNRGVNVNASFDRDDSELSGMNALMVASSRGYSNLVAELIKRGANVNLKRYTGETPLLLAAFNGDEKTIEALVRAGANPNVKVVSFHAGEITPLTSTINSAGEHRVEIARILISARAQVNPEGKFLMSPLMHAVGDFEMVRLLIANGANVNQKNVRGATALMAAAIGGTASVVSYLLEQGADVNARDEDGTTALMWAESRRDLFGAANREDVIQVLRKAQAKSQP